jgi:hypothetical protein
MATTMGGVSSAMVGLSVSDAGTSEGRLISRKTVDLVSAVYVPVAILMILYALFTYEWRSKFMHKKQVRRGSTCCWWAPVERQRGSGRGPCVGGVPGVCVVCGASAPQRRRTRAQTPAALAFVQQYVASAALLALTALPWPHTTPHHTTPHHTT